MPRIGQIFVLAFCSCALLSCTWNKQRLAEKPVVKVDDQELSLKDFSDSLSKQLKNFDGLVARSPGQIQRARDSVIRDFLLQAIILRFAKAQGIEISKQEREDEANRIRATYPDDSAFRKVLAEENIALNEWKKSVDESLIQQKVFATFRAKIQKPTEAEIKAYYDENKDRFKHPERVYIRQIVVDEFSKASDLRDAVKKKDFSELARKFSVAPEAKSGGVVGWVDKGSVDIFEKAFTQSTGSVSQVLESPYGFHIFKVDKKEPAGLRRLDEVRSLVENLIISQKEQKEYTQWLDKEIRSARVLIDYELIKQLKVETRTQDW